MITKKVFELIKEGVLSTSDGEINEMPRDSFLLINDVLCYYPHFESIVEDIEDDEYLKEYVVFTEETHKFSLIPWDTSVTLIDYIERPYIDNLKDTLKENKPKPSSQPVKNKAPLFL